MVIGSPAARLDLFVWSAAHGHYHLKDFNEFLLFTSSGALATVGYKQAFCAIDIERISPTASTTPNFTKCDNDQGISAGWADVCQGQSGGGDGRGLSTAKNPEGVRAEASTLSGFSTKLELLPRKVGLPVGSSNGLSTTRGPSQGCPRVGIRDRKASNPDRQAFRQRDYRDLVEPFAKQQNRRQRELLVSILSDKVAREDEIESVLAESVTTA